MFHAHFRGWFLSAARHPRRLFALGIGLTATGILLGIGVAKWLLVPEVPFSLILETKSAYPLIRPLIGIQTPASYNADKLAPLKSQIENIAKEEPGGTPVEYSYYYRDLTDASWIGVNENEQYDPASMLKIVIALAAYKQAAVNPDYFSQKLTYTQDLANINAAFPFAPPIALSVGQSYTIPHLLKLMLSSSDNSAKDLLLSSIDQSILDEVYTGLSIPKPDDTDSAGYTISPREYSHFLRALYYGTYNISWENSNQILQFLADASFTDGLVSGVPSSVRVAHKYGEHVIGSSGTASGIELSDCGIIYHPSRPYLLCIMTEGKDELSLSRFIADLSRATYTFVNNEE
ncbi:serine hydrolase [Patescibacteria group bacterium]|nr:serine hydrolase [Patescibacteria group bacterium]